MGIKQENNITARGAVKITTYDSNTGEKKRETDWMKNLVPKNSNSGVNLLVDAITDGKDIQIDEGKIGTDNTAPSDSDTDLGSVSVSGITVQSTSITTNTVTFSFFLTDSQLSNGTYEEFGLFESGNLFARSLFDSSYTKGTNEDTRIDHKITFNN